MISYLKGLLVSKNLTTSGSQIVIDVNNIGYAVLVNQKTYKELPSLKTEITIFKKRIKDSKHCLRLPPVTLAYSGDLPL